MKAETKAHRDCRMPRRMGPWCRRRLVWWTLSSSALGAAAAEGPATAPAAPGVEVLGQVTLSLILVVALLLGLSWLLRRLGRLQPQGGGSLRLLGGLSLGARERILLVQAENRRLLVGVSPGGLRTLLVLDDVARIPREATQSGSGDGKEALGPSWRIE